MGVREVAGVCMAGGSVEGWTESAVSVRAGSLFGVVGKCWFEGEGMWCD